MTQPNQSMVPNRRQQAKGAKLLAGLTAILLPCSAHAGNLYQTWLNNFDPNNGFSPSGRAVAVDKGGNVAVAGFTYVGGVQSFFTAKYDAFDGHQIWAKTFTAAGESEAKSVAFDGDGNVIATGTAALSGDDDYYTIKFRGSDGLPLWQKSYDGPNAGADEALFVAVDSANNVIITGQSVGTNSFTDIFTRKYDAAGNVASDFRYTSAGTRVDYPTGLAIDSAGKAVVCGISTNANGDTDFYLAKYDLSVMAGAADWTRIIGTNKDDEAHGVTIDSANSVIATGLLRRADNSHSFYTVKYDTDGAFKWEQNYTNEVAGDFQGGARSVAVNKAGDVFVTGTTVVDNFNTTFYTAKLFADTGLIDWSVRTPAPGNSDGDPGVNDQAVKVLIDGIGNPIVVGSAQVTGEGSDYYVVKYNAEGGGLVSERRFNGVLGDDLTDTLFAAAVDSFGNVVVTGDSKKAEGPNFQIITIKYGGTVLATGDPVVSEGIPEDAHITALSSPAVSTAGAVASRATLAAKKKRLSAILTAGNGFGIEVTAFEGGDAPQIADAKFKSFLDPIMSPNGRVAFIGKVGGVKSSEATGVWSNAFNPDGVLQLALQQGKQVPGMAQGITLQSVSSISLVNGQLLALIKVAGKDADVTKANSTVLYSLTAIGTGAAVLRTGDAFTDGGDTTIKSLSVFVPAKGSAGHGRYHAVGRAIARATLADKRTAIVAVNNNGSIKTTLAFTGDDASSITAAAKWNSFGLPSAATSLVPLYCVAGTLAVGEGDVTKGDDAVIGYSFNSGDFTTVAREGKPSPGIGGANFDSFLDPVVNANGNIAFIGTAKGQGVSSKNKTGIWFGPAANVSLVARTNHPDFKATDGSGAEIDATWSSFTSLALPGGTTAGPLFLAKISGKDANKKTGFGLWGVDSEGFVRKLIRNGDQFGDDLSVKKFSVLQPTSGSVGATRSFSTGGTVSLLVDFSDKSTGVINIAVP